MLISAPVYLGEGMCGHFSKRGYILAWLGLWARAAPEYFVAIWSVTRKGKRKGSVAPCCAGHDPRVGRMTEDSSYLNGNAPEAMTLGCCVTIQERVMLNHRPHDAREGQLFVESQRGGH